MSYFLYQGPFIDEELPAAVSRLDSPQRQGSKRGGKFCYYLTVGLDAEAAYRFNQVRNNKPHLAKYRWQNIGWYFYEAMATGWLLGAKPINRKFATFRVMPKPIAEQMTCRRICCKQVMCHCLGQLS